ncbi:Ig-like domain-containing protein [Fibrella sp. WM1]|uniref:Ig-like domain-containing protein n=1 Tax=Fibrella musci TaxID=3242485 RepID=UPI0035214956
MKTSLPRTLASICSLLAGLSTRNWLLLADPKLNSNRVAAGSMPTKLMGGRVSAAVFTPEGCTSKGTILRPTLWVTALLASQLILNTVLAQVSTIGFSGVAASGSAPTGNGPTSTPKTITFHQSQAVPTPPGAAYTPTITATVSLENQQFATIEGNPSVPGMSFGGTSSGSLNTAQPNAYWQSLAPGSYPFPGTYTGLYTGCNTCTVGNSSATATGDGVRYTTLGSLNFMLWSDALIGSDGKARAGITDVDANGQPNLSGSFYYGDLKITFNRPVSNPVLHFTDIGGLVYYNTNIGGTVAAYYQGFSTDFELLTPGLTLNKLSGNSTLAVSPTTIQNSASLFGTGPQGIQLGGQTRIAATGSVVVVGENITTVTFRLQLRGDGGAIRNSIGTTGGPGTATLGNFVQWAVQGSFAPCHGTAGCTPAGGINVVSGDLIHLAIGLQKPVTVSGHVWHDADQGNVNSSSATPIPAGIYANLIDTDGNVVDSQVVPNAGTTAGQFSFSAIGEGDYTVNISTTQGVQGQAAPTPSLPSGWSNTGEFNGASNTGNDGTINGTSEVFTVATTDVVDRNFGIRQVVCPTLTNGSGSQTLCVGASGANITVSTSSSAANGIRFVKFTSDQSAVNGSETAAELAGIYSGTSFIGTATPSGATSPYTASYTFNPADFPNTTAAPITYYVYAILNPDLGTSCRPVQEIKITVNPLPTLAGGELCVGSTITLTGSGTPAASTPYISGNTAVATVTNGGVVTGIAAGTATITYTDNNGCSVATTVTVKALAINATPTICNPTTNQYSVSGTVSLTNNTTGGVATLVDGTTSTTVPVAASAASVPYSLTGLLSDGASHIVTVTFAGCSYSAVYTAPASCSVAPICSLSALVSTGECATATNMFSNTVTVTMTNPTAGTLTVSDGLRSVTFAVPATTGTITAPAIFNGLPSDGTTHTVTVSLPGCSSLMTTYTAPVSCTAGAPTYAITKTVSQNRVEKGGIVTYTLSLTNTGNATGTNLVVTDQLSATAVTFVGSATTSTGTFTPADNSGSWTITTLAADQVATLRFQVQLNQEGITYNTATAPNGQTATACVTVPLHVCANTAFEIELSAPTGLSTYQWSRNGVPIAGATAATYSATVAGEYSVNATSNEGCPNGSCCPLVIVADDVPSLTAVGVAATCSGTTPLANASITLVSSSTNAVSYNISMGNSFTASAQLFAINQPLSGLVGGVLLSGQPNPGQAPGNSYTIRVYAPNGCYSDTVVVIPPALCQCPPVKCAPFVVRKVAR